VDALTQVSRGDLAAIGRGYLDHLARLFPDGRIVIDKQPDNVLLLGVLGQLFPNARFLNTTRERRDTVLSIYFQQFDESLPWAADLRDIVHQMAERDRLLEHWRASVGERLLDVSYEALIDDAPAVLQRVCSLLGVEWRDEMLSFHMQDSRVRTASVWQVRQPLYRASIGRWRHYAAHLDATGAFATRGAAT
jgi:hypothetical protein